MKIGQRVQYRLTDTEVREAIIVSYTPLTEKYDLSVFLLASDTAPAKNKITRFTSVNKSAIIC